MYLYHIDNIEDSDGDANDNNGVVDNETISYWQS